jgi:hypothetical protein
MGEGTRVPRASRRPLLPSVRMLWYLPLRWRLRLALPPQVMYGSAGPAAIKDALRGLIGTCCTLHRIARFYGTPERMTTLFRKITNQMMRACRWGFAGGWVRSLHRGRAVRPRERSMPASRSCYQPCRAPAPCQGVHPRAGQALGAAAVAAGRQHEGVCWLGGSRVLRSRRLADALLHASSPRGGFCVVGLPVAMHDSHPSKSDVGQGSQERASLPMEAALRSCPTSPACACPMLAALRPGCLHSRSIRLMPPHCVPFMLPTRRQTAKDLADAYKATFHSVRDEMARDDGKVGGTLGVAAGGVGCCFSLPGTSASYARPAYCRPAIQSPSWPHPPIQTVAPQRLEVDERAVFLKFDLFAKRLGKLCDMFTSIHQISSLEQHTHITGGQRVPWALRWIGTLHQWQFL